MPNVQITVRLRWQARADIIEAPILQVFRNSLTDKSRDSTHNFFWVHG